MTQLFNCEPEKDKRRILRRERPPAEAVLWAKLRNRQVGGRKFRRQHSVGVYVLDFYCAECHLAVELDGDSHDGADAQAYDTVRSEFLAVLGIQVARFANQDVYQRLEFVVEAVHFLTAEETSP